MRRETFLEILLELDIPKPSAINYHRDNGVFRGLAFANFKTPEEASFVISLLNGFDIAGRKLRVEYKLIGAGLFKESHNELGTIHCKETQPVDKNNAVVLERIEKSATTSSSEKDEDMEKKFMDKSEENDKMRIEEHKFTSDKHSDDIDMSIPDARSFYEELVAFRDEDGHHDLVYLNSLNLYQRALLQLIVQKLDMSYKCDGEDENWHMRISRKGAPNSVSILSTGKTLKKTRSGNGSSESISGLGKTSLKANHGSVGISAHGSRSSFRSNLRRVDGLPSVCPVRQPRGPDLSQNFALRRSLRD
ncbi:Peptidyl-prolyl cis-trans isomerase pin4, variant 2 [Basidiobolus ranarum]